MYKLQDKQIGLTDFAQPLGMKLNSKNRWVQKASLIPWDEIEVKYATLFESKTGNVAKPLRLALGSLLIQIEFDYSDEEIVNQIQENPYLQYFVGFPNYKDQRPFDSSLMVHFRKRLTLDVLISHSQKYALTMQLTVFNIDGQVKRISQRLFSVQMMLKRALVHIMKMKPSMKMAIKGY